MNDRQILKKPSTIWTTRRFAWWCILILSNFLGWKKDFLDVPDGLECYWNDLRTGLQCYLTRKQRDASLMVCKAVTLNEQSELVFVDINLSFERYYSIQSACLLQMAVKTFENSSSNMLQKDRQPVDFSVYTSSGFARIEWSVQSDHQKLLNSKSLKMSKAARLSSSRFWKAVLCNWSAEKINFQRMTNSRRTLYFVFVPQYLQTFVGRNWQCRKSDIVNN